MDDLPKTWKAGDGSKLPIRDMDTQHIINSTRYLRRKATNLLMNPDGTDRTIRIKLQMYQNFMKAFKKELSSRKESKGFVVSNPHLFVPFKKLRMKVKWRIMHFGKGESIMKKLALLIVMMGSGSMLHAQSLAGIPALVQSLETDVKTNSGFKLETAMSAYEWDWTSGTSWAGEKVPFAHLGSYIYCSAGYSHALNSAKGYGLVDVGPGLRLNDTIRPLVLKALQNNSTLKDNTALVQGLANALSLGVDVTHDVNYTEKDRVVFNRVMYYLGFEYGYGAPSPALPSTQSVPMPGSPTALPTQKWYVR